jgi:hypothetical protein
MDMPYVVRRPELNLWEKLYLPSIVGGMWITLGHMAKNDFWTIIFAAIRWASLLDGYERDGIIDDAVS